MPSLVRNTYHIYISIRAFALQAPYASVPASVAPTGSEKLCLLSAWIKETERLSQPSPSMRIRYCHLLSAVISLPGSDSLLGAAICYNVFLSCVWLCVFLKRHVIFAHFHA